MAEMKEENAKKGEEEGVSLFLPTKRDIEGRIRVYPLGGSYAVIIPKAWLEIFHCDDKKGNFWVTREIDSDTITIKPPEQS